MEAKAIVARDADGLASRLGILGLLRGLLRPLNWLFGRFSKVGNFAIFDPLAFPWTNEVERHAPAIRAEVDALIESGHPIPGFEEISKEQRILSRDRRWKTYFFLAYGVAVEEHCRACRASWAAIRAIPGVVTAFFSILEPGKELPPHRGLYKGVLRYHLAVRIPGDGEQCGLVVAGKTCRWVEAGSLVFDDTFVHAAYNHSDEIRVVMFVDFVRPLHFPANLLNRLFILLVRHSRYLRVAKRKLQSWESAHGPGGGGRAATP